MGDVQVWRLQEPRDYEIRADYVARTDFYYTEGMSTPDGHSEAFAAGLPACRQSAFNDGTIVKSVRLVKTLNPQAPFANVYQVVSYLKTSGQIGYRRSPRGGSQLTDFPLPNFTSDVGAGAGPPVYIEVPPARRVHVYRARIYQTRSIQTSGYDTSDFTVFDAINVGRALNLNEVPHLYLGTQYVIDPTNQIRLSVNFMTTGVVPLFKKGTIPGYDFDLPQLNPLQEYVVKPPASPGDTPSISVSDPGFLYGKCAEIPWLK